MVDWRSRAVDSGHGGCSKPSFCFIVCGDKPGGRCKEPDAVVSCPDRGQSRPEQLLPAGEPVRPPIETPAEVSHPGSILVLYGRWFSATHTRPRPYVRLRGAALACSDLL
jgi:hypothetical protein